MHDTLEKAYSLIEQYLRQTDRPIVFELGVCSGNHTQMLLSWCRNVAYFGFEPDPRNIALVTAGGIQRYINFEPAAVGNVTGKVTFHLATKPPDSTGCIGSSSISEFTPVLTQCWPWLKEEGQAEVDCWRLDDYCNVKGIDHIDFLWMDVQGAERLVFEGAQNILKRTGLLWTEYDGGTLYKDSSTVTDILKWFPGWHVLADCGGDVLLHNPGYLAAKASYYPASTA